LSGARACPTCGALNGADFARCIRCGSGLTEPSAVTGLLGFRIDASRLWATKLIGALTALVFLGQLAAARARDGSLPILTGGSPIDALHYGALIPSPEFVAAEPFRLLSSVFVHFGLLHFGLNMLAFYNLSRATEPAVGSARFTVAYVVSGIVGFATSVVWGMVTGARMGLTAGASGAIFGVMGLILGWLLRRKDPRWKQFAVQAVLYSMVFGFAVNASNVGVMVNNSAHLGGLACGLLFGLVFGGRREARSSWTDAVANVGAVICLLACVASLLLAQRSPLPRTLEQELSVVHDPDPTPGVPAREDGEAAPPDD
jgi:rhomboid protease GluP